MASLSTFELKKSISSILKGADLTALSSKKVRKKLEEQYDADFSDRKEEIDQILMAMITAGENDKQSGSEDAESEEENSDRGRSPQNSESEEEKEHSSKPAAKRKREKEATNDVKSESCSESEGEIEDKRPPPKKTKPAAKKKPKKEGKSGNDSEKSDDDVDDEALARKLQEEERNSRSRAVKKNFNKKESGKKSSKSKGEGKPRKESVYSRKCALSADLASVVGASEMARHDIVKKMWSVVRERNLFDPKNKRFAICDEQLQKVFGTKRVLMFGMMKYLKNHIKDQH